MEQRTKKFLTAMGVIGIGAAVYTVWKKCSDKAQKTVAMPNEASSDCSTTESPDSHIITQEYIERRRQRAKERREKRMMMDQEKVTTSVAVENIESVAEEVQGDSVAIEEHESEKEIATELITDEAPEQMGTDAK